MQCRPQSAGAAAAAGSGGKRRSPLEQLGVVLPLLIRRQVVVLIHVQGGGGQDKGLGALQEVCGRRVRHCGSAAPVRPPPCVTTPAF